MQFARVFAAMAALVISATALAAAPIADGVKGLWSGHIDVMGQKLGIRVKFTTDTAATIDIPDQGVTAMKLSDVTYTPPAVTFRMPEVPGEPSFKGTVKGDEMTGQFTQSGGSFPFTLKRTTAEAVRRPQDPKPPFPYRSEEVTVQSAGAKLAGTLTLPQGEGPFPAVLLITGSGPQNRDSELFDHRPFLVWADHLTRAGFAVLRVDDRGVGQSTGVASRFTDLVADAAACVRHLRTRKDIGSVGLLGHSQGAEVAARVAANDPKVAWVVLLAGIGTDGASNLAEQNRAIFKAAGMSDEGADKVCKAAKALFDGVLANAPESKLRELARALMLAQTSVQDIPEAEVDEALKQLRSPGMRDLLANDIRNDLKKVRVPVLALLGGKDVQVPASYNRPALDAAFKPMKDATVRVFPKCNHLFQPATTGGLEEYGTIATTIDPEVLDAVKAWMLERSK
ncbi:MAG TPA: alpha/beta hydrolase [Phycisphaerales bacterium]|nr:alpha/beta hydrolase [Phycisphaerales bacterium]